MIAPAARQRVEQLRVKLLTSAVNPVVKLRQESDDYQADADALTALLARVDELERTMKKVPSPWQGTYGAICCKWCYVSVKAPYATLPVKHPDNGCLWPMIAALLTAVEPKE